MEQPSNVNPATLVCDRTFPICDRPSILDIGLCVCDNIHTEINHGVLFATGLI